VYNPNPEVLAAVLQHSPNFDDARKSWGNPLLKLCTYKPEDFKAEHLRLLLAAGANVNATDDDGETALMRAAQFRNPEAVKMLLAAGADPALVQIGGGGSALNKAVSREDYASAFALIEAGSPVRFKRYESPLERLAQNRSADPKLARLLLEKMGEPRGPEAEKALVYAAESGAVPLVEMLLERRMPQDILDVALAKSVCNGNPTKIVALLLEAGANPNVTYGNPSIPLISWAAYYGYPGHASLLLKAAADPNLVDAEGQNSVHNLVSGGRRTISHNEAGVARRKETLALLLDAGANVKVKDNDRKTPLALAKEDEQTAYLYEMLRAVKK
jgi:ankyrin repeat protein